MPPTERIGSAAGAGETASTVTGGRHARLVRDFLEASADRLPEKTAVICGQRRVTYHELDAAANRLAHSLADMGVRRGDRVAIHLPNSIEAVTAIFAALKAGAVFVVINPTTKRDKLLYILNNCRARALVIDSRGASQAGSGIRPADAPALAGLVLVGPPGSSTGSEIPTISFETAVQAGSESRPARRNIDLDLACLIYTSGTTGEPKGVMSDNSNVVFAVGSITEYLENVESDVVLNVLPLSFDYGLYQLLMAFSFGGTLVLERSFTYPAAILKLIEAERVTGFPGVPTIFALLLDMDLSPFDLSSLRYVTNTAAALPPSHIQKIQQIFPHATLFSMYGLTETKRTLYLPPAELQRKPGSVGVPIPGTEAWIEDETGQRLKPGETGELVVRGRHVMRGYWEAPELTAARFQRDAVSGDRICRTGDLFRVDDDGFFTFVARKDDIIKCRGEKVAPREVESAIAEMEQVREVAVLGVPDPILGQAIIAYVVARDPALTEKQVLAHCRHHLEDYMIPRTVELRADLPKNASGKVDRNALRSG